MIATLVSRMRARTGRMTPKDDFEQQADGLFGLFRRAVVQ
jgi:hypothetical protein